MMFTLRDGLVVLALGSLLTGCAAKVPAASAPSRAAEATAVEVLPVAPTAPDPIGELIEQSNRHFDSGQRELNNGHLDAAKAEFNQALEVLLESQDGALAVPRIREHFDWLVARISAFELTALAQGDGFTEKRYEPASIDDLLAIATFPPATEETEQAVVDDLQTTTHDIEIPLNERVLSFVQLFSGKLRSYLEEGLSRGARFLPMIQDVFRAEGLPLDLAYVPLIESAFKPSAVSRAKAKGLWQFMRGTALENGLQHDWYIDERADPEKATYAAAKYLKTLYNMFGDWHLALASYNGGPGRVQRALKQSRRDDFWALSAGTRYLPKETRDYVPLILAAVIVARNPAQYGLNIEPLEDLAVERVTLSAPVDLRRIAEWAGTPIQVIQDLNPELRRWTTPVRAVDYELKVPAESADVIRARLAETSPEELVPLSRHTVAKGETLLSIARKLKVSKADLAEANFLSANARLTAGQQLIIPRAPALLLAVRGDSPAPTTGDQAPDAVAAVNIQDSEPAIPAGGRIVHRVKRGDTLSSIAQLYRTTVASLKEWNRIRGNVIQVGQRLTIFPARTVATN